MNPFGKCLQGAKIKHANGKPFAHSKNSWPSQFEHCKKTKVLNDNDNTLHLN